MAAKKQKYYVVWEGEQPGIYTDWNTCKKQVEHFLGAKYKSFETKEEAENAFAQQWSDFIHPSKQTIKRETELKQAGNYETNAIAVDAACSGNPGKMEYQGVDLSHGGRQIFHWEYPKGTNNIGEFLAIVHGLSMLKQTNCPFILYSDSQIAISWVKQKQCKTKLARTPETEKLLDIVARAEAWLQNNTYTTEIRKWHTQLWGEIPADFGRK
ncbi:MAG: ribonuclease H family protein [Bacteroidales bacterium]|nr:ribonuclease H family protein [Candidatus Physcocola equi]